MTQAAQAPVRGTYAGTADEEFSRLTEPYRRELLAHCYRMLGSTHDAQDVVQETYLRAWRGFSGFEGRSSLRVWLYRIATSACLTTLKHRSRRVLPSGLGPSGDPDQPLTVAGPDVAWVNPLPDAELPVTDPATIVSTRSSVRLALVAALQYLPARQRAVLILRDVLAWHASEVADLLDTTTDAVNSALARARAHLARTGLTEDMFAEPADPADRMLLDRYARAFQNADTAALLQVLREDVTMEMPPHLTWFAGRDAVTRFLATTVFGRAGAIRAIPATANGQPALATYTRGAEGLHHPHSLQVLTATPTGVSRIVSFHDASLFEPCGLPTCLDEAGRPVGGR
ncbi:sigma-70 family RNA polymerase sigma factor [Micromonospora sp. NPDC023888]|uniref:sigma-70 family RNA polymerase sigma factor n=1 Tax=Micromonospora sp. NPDC023888 TaxID=3155607 RepID=UPI0033D31EFD